MDLINNVNKHSASCQHSMHL